MRFFDINSITIDSQKLFLIAGPCVLDETDAAFEIASEVSKVSKELDIPFIFKASYAKANRTSATSYRGLGIQKGLETLATIKERFGVPVLSDVHQETEVEEAAQVLDVLQIPAFLCRQTSLLEKAAETQKVVNIKKGQFMSPADMKYAAQKVTQCNNPRLFLTERGASFGYNNLVVDMRSFAIMKNFGHPVVFDGTHSVQLPGAGQGETAGQREMIPYLVRAAVAAGCDGLFLEVHPEPEKSPSDSASILPLSQLKSILQQAIAIKTSLQSLEKE